MAPQWRAIEPAWVNEMGEIQTWLATVPIVLFMYVRFHHVDRVKRQFGSEQPVPLDPVNLDGFLRASARGDDRWWPDELAYWYGFWRNRRSRDHQIQIERDPIVLPRDALARGRRAQMQSPDIRRKGESASSSGRVDSQPGGADEDEEAEYDRQEDIPDEDGDQDPGGDGPAPHDPDLDFFSGADLELARFMEYGGGSGSGSGPQLFAGGIVASLRPTE
ncbi:hypothetical protein PIB30_047556 [Stylosanthes scabra]|uniref:Uncharacterized protein n=1 Tax=Stylosanthes scabra TaxID=79078 RepID=A0ABU6UIP0_9FABA|nr:hypothetical protein [Stylosanthes scabra]